ncbi:MAG: chemotaxis protein CheX [Planctomycetes bacterium]|nr:chemotaxis protein CheX [Planctomycetota bacterium]
MDARFINPFVSAIRQVFETMVHTPVRVGKPMLKSAAGHNPDVSGVIGFSGDAAGCVILSFSFDVAAKVASSFAAATITPEHPDFADAIGELANMVAGNAKAEFHGLSVSISLPSVIVGRDHAVSQSRNFPHIVIPCETCFGAVNVEVGMKSERPQPARPVPAGATP